MAVIGRDDISHPQIDGVALIALPLHRITLQCSSSPVLSSTQSLPSLRPIIAIATIAAFLNAMRAAPLPLVARSVGCIILFCLPEPACAGLHAKQLFLSRFRCFANRHCLPRPRPSLRPSLPPSIAVARIKKSSASVGEGEEEEEETACETIVSDFGVRTPPPTPPPTPPSDSLTAQRNRRRAAPR